MNIALILAAGSGTRMGNTEKPKQFLLLYGKPLMIHTIEAFENHNNIDAIVVCTNKEYIDQVKVWCKQYDLCKVKAVVAGGETRQQSVFNGLNEVKGLIKSEDDVVLIHDAARPLISYKIIDDNIEGCEKFGAVDTVVKASDTIVQSADSTTITNIPNRNELYQGQTPQSFKFSLIYNAHLKAMNGEIKNVTDDAKLVIESGHPVHLVNGSAQNFKITTFDDLMLLKALLKVGKNGVL
jgi:2-C-methyl-D-erythritol 4-phosphate cytidylyltransferase